ncbi:MAG: hypothetical protein HYS81_04260 [Candidatus Aenigmatarchaeota archaeon]|nr:MAG: hypothetical protein HYS81_04260 [Candidatus Aenigmarchaeota archaeon]
MLEATALFERTFKALAGRHTKQEFEAVYPAIGAYDDFGKTVHDRMIYQSAVIIPSGDAAWAVCRGELDEPHGLPRRLRTPEVVDMAAVRMPMKNGRVPEELLRRNVRDAERFSKSLVIGKRHGPLMVPERGLFGRRMGDALKPLIGRYADGHPPIETLKMGDNIDHYVYGGLWGRDGVDYKAKFVPVLAKTIEDVVLSSKLKPLAPVPRD